MTEKIKNLYDKYDVIEGIKASGENSYTYKTSFINDIIDKHPLYDPNSSVQDIYASISNPSNEIVEHLAKKQAEKNSEFQKLAEESKYGVITKQDKNYKINSASYTNETKELKLRSDRVFLGAIMDVLENPNISDAKKDQFLHYVKETKRGKGTTQEFAAKLRLASVDVTSAIEHEFSHAKDFALVDYSSLDKYSQFTFLMVTELNSFRHEGIYLLENNPNGWESYGSIKYPQTKEKIDNYYKENGLQAGKEIPQKHKQGINDMLALAFINDKKRFDESPRVDTYRDQGISLLKGKSDDDCGKDSVTTVEMFDRLGIDVSKDVLNAVHNSMFYPTSDYYKTMYAMSGLMAPSGKFTDLDKAVTKPTTQSNDNTFAAVAALKSLSEVKG